MTIPWKWAVAMGPMKQDGIDQIPSICCEAGISRLEGGFRSFESLSDAEFERIADRFEQAGVRFDTFHLPFGIPVDIADFYETRRREAVARNIRCIERSARLGATVGIQHPTTCLYHADEEGCHRFIDQLKRSLDELSPVAERYDYTIALENIPTREHGPRFGSLPEHFEMMTATLDYPNVGFCLDTGHALMSLGLHQETRMFEAMGSRLVAFHLADNAGDRDAHLAPGRGLVDWTTVFRRAEALPFRGTMCIETPPFAPGPRYAPEAWRQLVSDTAALAEEALVSRVG